MNNILQTGATGFVGGAVLDRLTAERGDIAAAVRTPQTDLPANVRKVVVPNLDVGTDWSEALEACSVVIHCAARVHVMNDQSSDPLAEFRKVNVDGTLNLARQAAAAGAKRFIFISSIKVNGEDTALGRPYTAFDTPVPQDPYGISKMEAEKGVRLIAQETGMEVVIIRPVLVYGPEVKANFRSMMSWMNKGVPLPLGAINNKRSLVSLDNLVDLIVTCIDHPAAANQTFLVSDDEDLSTTEMLRRMARALGKPARLIPVPSAWLESGAALLGKRAVAQRLCGSLQVDIRHTRETLNWTPPVSVDEGFRATAAAFLNE
ncbi:SDR family oxidoreductase [Halopseudomonas sp. SMJS2]|uniref:UDP-glucose 4-epimerase family protein n=1 Tax=Halopseudomonas sp. SMJS2 TaxID=3041098 RepID=UPI0024537022|nr:SDR family oxidoreductase [Halopseudomonas sp. SMJS2]WGK60359.1 SDR family oxidoreductase [Halopseudomonas sp. SMJS2]